MVVGYARQLVAKTQPTYQMSGYLNFRLKRTKIGQYIKTLLRK